jgi:hypothetical protein
MTQKEFIKKLDREGYSYEIEGDKLVVTHEGDVNLQSLKSLPPGVEFKNKGDVWLNALKSLPPGVVFSNEGSVRLHSLTSIPPGVEFSNEGHVYLESLIGGWFFEWQGNIEGIDSKRLLNLMIKRGMFI